MAKVTIRNLMKETCPVLLKRNGKLITEYVRPGRRGAITVDSSELLPDTQTKVIQKRIKLT